MSQENNKSDKIPFYQAFSELEKDSRLMKHFEKRYSGKSYSLSHWKKLLK